MQYMIFAYSQLMLNYLIKSYQSTDTGILNGGIKAV